MAKQELVIEAQRRTGMGKNASRRLRREGRIPVVLYGGEGAAMPLEVEPKALELVLHSEAGENTLFGVRIAGDGMVPGKVMIKEHQVDPITSRLVHADFMRIAMDRAIRVQVAIQTVGIARGVKLSGGILDYPLREVEVECLPADIPEHIDVDITELDLGKAIRVADLVMPSGVKMLTDAGMAVVAVVAPTVEKAPVAGAEGAPVAEAPAEPEVIRKGKAETAEEGEEGKPAAKGGDKGGKPEKK